MSMIRSDIDNDDLRYMREVKGMTYQEIADYYGAVYSTIYNRLHPEEHRERSRKYRQEHPEQVKECIRKWMQEHPEEAREYARKWLQTPNGKAWTRKKSAVRRELGFIALNDPFDGYEAHHIDEEHVIYMPVEIHQSIPHNLKTGEGMEEINKEAMDFYMYEIQEGIILRG